MPSFIGYLIIINRKIGEPANIQILLVQVKIINEYVNHDMCQDNGPVLPLLSKQKINAIIKEIAHLCGFTKNLSFHVVRHTFATTVTLTNGIPIESVSKMLGNKNIQSTQHYARIVDKKVGDDMHLLSRKIENLLSLTI
jgi:site-specific recombinase XerD